MLTRLRLLEFFSALAVACFLTLQPAVAEGFPGRGSASDWSDAIPYYNLGNRYLSQGRYEDAAEKYKGAISRYQFDPDFYVNLGVAYRKAGDYSNAELALKKATQLNGKDWMPWSDLANVYLKQDKLKDAVATFERTLKCSPPDAEKAAILNDIKDINKILKMSGQLPLEGPAKPTSASKNAGRPKAVKTPPVLDTTGSGTTKSTTGVSTQPGPLKDSGWDYVYGH